MHLLTVAGVSYTLIRVSSGLLPNVQRIVIVVHSLVLFLVLPNHMQDPH